ncbi:MAG: hypothetical protein IE937_11585 [Gammaproteobacteria bacterium]|nr:hypothetical protein [Gammaproteobacteria bacterium]
MNIFDIRTGRPVGEVSPFKSQIEIIDGFNSTPRADDLVIVEMFIAASVACKIIAAVERLQAATSGRRSNVIDIRTRKAIGALIETMALEVEQIDPDGNTRIEALLLRSHALQIARELSHSQAGAA